MSYIIAIIAIIVIGIGFTLFNSQDTGTPEPTTTTELTVSTPTNNEASDYDDGAHTTTVTYMTPKRDEYSMDVSLTLAGDIITDAQIVYSNGAENDPNAAKFEAAYRVEVIGKDIDTLNLSRVGGASLTTAAFNNALQNIKADAKS